MANSVSAPKPVLSMVDQFLASVNAPAAASRGRLVFVLDATASREATWDRAVHLQAEMFREVAAIGGLDLKLVHFGGTVPINAECLASKWLSDPMVLAAYMTKIRCKAGLTQIGRALDHVLQEPLQPKIGAVVYVGDDCEETMRDLTPAAMRLADRDTRLFMFQEGHNPEAELIFRNMTEITGGAYERFSDSSARMLGELLRAVAVFAAGGRLALERQGSSAARLLLGQMR